MTFPSYIGSEQYIMKVSTRRLHLSYSGLQHIDLYDFLMIPRRMYETPKCLEQIL